MRYGMVLFVLATALLGRAAHAQEGPYEVLPESVQCFPYTTCSYITFGTSYYAAMNVNCACGDTLNQEEYSWPSISISISVGVGPVGPCIDVVDSTLTGDWTTLNISNKLDSIDETTGVHKYLFIYEDCEYTEEVFTDNTSQYFNFCGIVWE